MVTKLYSFDRHTWDFTHLKLEMNQLTISRRQVGRSIPFKQNFFGSLQQTVEWDTFLKCVQLSTKYLDFQKELGKNKHILVIAI